VAPRSKDPNLIIRVITFELTQHIVLKRQPGDGKQTAYSIKFVHIFVCDRNNLSDVKMAQTHKAHKERPRVRVES